MEYLGLLFSLSNLLLLGVAVMAVFMALCIAHNSKSWKERGGLLELKNKTLVVLCYICLFACPVLLLIYVAMYPLDMPFDFFSLILRALMFFGLSMAAGLLFMLTITICLTIEYNKTKKQEQ